MVFLAREITKIPLNYTFKLDLIDILHRKVQAHVIELCVVSLSLSLPLRVVVFYVHILGTSSKAD